MTTDATKRVRPGSVPAPFHVAIGLAGVIASAIVASGRDSVLLAVAAITYVAWTTSRTAALILTFAATFGRFAIQFERGVESFTAAVLLVACTVYAFLAIVVSAIERNTRPP